MGQSSPMTSEMIPNKLETVDVAVRSITDKPATEAHIRSLSPVKQDAALQPIMIAVVIQISVMSKPPLIRTRPLPAPSPPAR